MVMSSVATEDSVMAVSGGDDEADFNGDQLHSRSMRRRTDLSRMRASTMAQRMMTTLAVFDDGRCSGDGADGAE